MKTVYLNIIILAGLISLACTTRVSEWVLLNALPNKYTLIYFHNGKITETLKKQNMAVTQRMRTANIQFKSVTIQDIKNPYWGLFYKDKLLSKYYNPDELRNLTTSPLREKIAAELMSGKLCVLVYLKSGNKEKDDKGLKTLQNALKSSLFGKIITVCELSRDSKVEVTFASLLLKVEDDLKGINEPMIFGIYGRFKALEPLLGKGISEENINMMIDYLTSECSCLIKDDLPGTDILFTDKWDNPQPALLNKIIDDNLSVAR